MWTLCLLFLVGCVSFLLVPRLHTSIRRRRSAKIDGTRDPIHLRDVAPPPPEGSFTKQSMKAFREHRFLELIKERHELAGYTYQSSSMGVTTIHTSDPENYRAMLSRPQDFGLDFRMRALGPLLGKGIFTADGHDWASSRAMIRPNFAIPKISDFSVMAKHVEKMVASIPRDGRTFDIQDKFLALAFDTSTEFLFGESVNSATAPSGSKQAEFVAAFDYASGELVPRLAYGKLIFLYRNKAFDRACKTVHEFVDNIIHRAVERRRARAAAPEKEDYRPTFIDGLLDQVTDPLRIRSELLNVLQAGRDTTASLLSHMFYLLARHPKVWATLIEEVNALEGALPTYKELHAMRKMQCFIKESLRVWPVAPINSRDAACDTMLPTGGGPDHRSPIFIPKGTKISFPSFAMHRSKAQYGPDADELRPERWEDPNFRPGWAYVPFSGGPRKCLGQQFALTNATYTAVRILQTFDKIEKKDDGRYEEGIRISLSIHSGVKIALTPRKD